MGSKRRFSKNALFKRVGYVPHAGQCEVHASRARRRVLACGVRFGKSLAAAMEALAGALAPCERSVGWIVAPTYDLSERIFNLIVMIVVEFMKHRIVMLKQHEHRLIILNLQGGLSEIRGKSADNPVSLLGEGLSWVVIDEAARLRQEIWENYISQRLIDHNGWALLLSTPRGRGWFYDAWKRGQGVDPDWKSWNMPTWANPLIDRKLIEADRLILPERSFRQEYGAEFIEGDGSVFRYVREAAKGEWQAPQSGARYYAGLDLAKVNDFTVMVIMNHRREVVFADRFHRLDWGLQMQRIRAALSRYGDARVLVDTTGVGEPLFEQMVREGLRADPYLFTAKSKSDLVNNLSLLFEKRLITIPRFELFPECVDECEAFEYSVTDSGNVRMSAPGSQHDDIVMALGLAAWQVENAPTRPIFGVIPEGVPLSTASVMRALRGRADLR